MNTLDAIYQRRAIKAFDPEHRLTTEEETKLLETRKFRFHCGCNLERILPILGGWQNRLDELFHGAAEITIQCPRCAASYRVARGQLESADPPPGAPARPEPPR